MKYYADISTNDCYRVYFDLPDGMGDETFDDHEAIQQYIYDNWGEWEKEPRFAGSEDEVISFGPTTPEVTP